MEYNAKQSLYCIIYKGIKVSTRTSWLPASGKSYDFLAIHGGLFFCVFPGIHSLPYVHCLYVTRESWDKETVSTHFSSTISSHFSINRL